MIDTVTVAAKERSLLTRLYDSDLGRQLTQDAKKLHGRASDPILTIDQQAELVKRIVDSGGDRAVADLQAALDLATSRAQFYATQYAGRAKTLMTLREALPKVIEHVREARTYRERLSALANESQATASAAPVDPAIAPAPTEVEEVHAIMMASDAAGFVADLNALLATMEQELPYRLSVVTDEIEATSARHAKGPQNHGLVDPHDAIWDRLGWLISRREDLEAKIARITGDKSKAVAVQASAVAAVVASAGGKDVVVKAITDSRSLKDRYWQSHPDWSGTHAKSNLVASIQAQLAKLGDNPTGPLAEQLKAELGVAGVAWQSNSSEVDADLQAQLARLVDAAMAGDEPARVEILGDALAEPRAFPPGFADQLDAAMFPRTREGSALLALVLSTGLPLS